MVMFCCAAMDCSIRDSSLRNWCPWSWVGKYVRPCRDYENCNEGLGVHSSNGLVTTFNGNDVDGAITETRILQFLSYSGNKDNLKNQIELICCYLFLDSPLKKNKKYKKIHIKKIYSKEIKKIKVKKGCCNSHKMTRNWLRRFRNTRIEIDIIRALLTKKIHVEKKKSKIKCLWTQLNVI